MAAGTIPVTTNDFALRTTVSSAGVLIDGKPGTLSYDSNFAKAIVRLLVNEDEGRIN